MSEAKERGRHIGRVIVSDDMLADLLDFQGGKVLQAAWSVDWMGLVLFIEHPDMPECIPGGVIPEVCPVYDATETREGGLVLRRITRRREG